MGERQTLLLEISYDGLAFHGIAPQPGLETVGGQLTRHLEALFEQRPRGLAVAARTDAGVSAQRNFVTCWVRDVGDLAARCERLSSSGLCPSLRVLGVWLVPRSVHARNGATCKHYRYRIEHGIATQPLPGRAAAQPHTWCIAPSLDPTAMIAAARSFIGTHDFASLRAPNCGAGSTVKTLQAVDVGATASQIVIDVVGDAFLRKMVRILVGTLAEVGAGLRSPQSMATLLEARRRDAAGLTAPARGLSLVDVHLNHPLSPPHSAQLYASRAPQSR